MSVRIIIAEDQVLVRQGLMALLASQDVTILAEAEDGAKAVKLTAELKPDLVLMDLNMPLLNGVEATAQIRKQSPKTKVLILTVAHCERRVAEAMGAGANGFALKRLGQDELMSAIGAVMSGQTYVGPGLDRALVDGYLQENSHMQPKLTGRERQILSLIAKGLRNREIADQLQIAIKTVETHRTKVMQKLDLHNSAEITSYAHSHGLVD